MTGLLAMVVTGLALLGGVYFPLDVLPEPLRSLGNILPFTWGLDTIRSALLNGTVDAPRLAGLVGSRATLFTPSLKPPGVLARLS